MSLPSEEWRDCTVRGNQKYCGNLRSQKTYLCKGGGSVNALDGVSLSFGERGIVFILGKSTLLDLCGGFDFPDGGEIVINGQSDKTFLRTDFDSYRNTYVGFVFQEYNVLDEFSVDDNISLALDLQGKNKDRHAVEDILKKVDLSVSAKRKPSTLSGGQKQRIAIARALVKDPETFLQTNLRARLTPKPENKCPTF